MSWNTCFTQSTHNVPCEMKFTHNFGMNKFLVAMSVFNCNFCVSVSTNRKKHWHFISKPQKNEVLAEKNGISSRLTHTWRITHNAINLLFRRLKFGSSFRILSTSISVALMTNITHMRDKTMTSLPSIQTHAIGLVDDDDDIEPLYAWIECENNIIEIDEMKQMDIHSTHQHTHSHTPMLLRLAI